MTARPRDSERVENDAELLPWLGPLADRHALVATDAPSIVRNRTARQPAEQAISRCFSAHHASAHLGPHRSRDGAWRGGFARTRPRPRLVLPAARADPPRSRSS